MRRDSRIEQFQYTFFGVFLLIMMAVFAAEVAIMQMFSELFTSLTILPRALLDASTFVLIAALPLWFFIFSPAFCQQIGNDRSYESAAIPLYVKVLGILFLIQFVIMLLLPQMMTYFPAKFENLVDGVLTVVFSAVLFGWLLYRLELLYRLKPLLHFLSAPTALYLLLLFMIFLADLLQEMLFPQIQFHMPLVLFQLFDALVTVALIAPLLLILVIHPLRRMARSEQARTLAVYDQVVDAIIKINHAGLIESFNLAAKNIFGIQDQEIAGLPASLLLDPSEIDLDQVIEQLNAPEAGGRLDFNDLTASRLDGSPLTLNVSISKVRLDGPPEFLLLLRDISERKATEAALNETDAIFREIFDQTEDAILFFDSDGGAIQDVNSTAEAIYGFTKAELQQAGARAFCSDDGYRRFIDLIVEIQEKGSAQIDSLQNHRKDGQSIIVSLRGKMVLLQGAPVIYLTARDITERVRLENEAREIQSKLIHMNKMTSLGLLVSGVTHEINNPNNYVLSNAQLLAKIWKDVQIVLREYYLEHGDFILGGVAYSELENSVPELLGGLTDGSQRISAIINDLKRFVRQDNAQYSYDVNLNAVATAAVSMLHYELVKYTDNFHLDLAADLPTVKGSSQQLGQVIINLLMNACQALPDKSRGVWLTTSYDPIANLVRLSVRDQGTGLPDESRERVLEPFFTTKTDSGGTGLGLSISLSIIKEHGGQLNFFSQGLTGTTFTVTLPVSSLE